MLITKQKMNKCLFSSWSKDMVLPAKDSCSGGHSRYALVWKRRFGDADEGVESTQTSYSCHRSQDTARGTSTGYTK